ncbi:MAG: DegV family protein [Clostridia bacterium]|nr:DegV family protein [Clostridia bacterium]
MSVKIISDSTCDLSPELIAKYGIHIVPLHIVLGDKEFADGASITPDEIYEWSDANKATPKTSALGLEEAVEVFKPMLADGSELVCFSISGTMSTTCNVMRLAAQDLDAADRIFVIDSENLSTGIGLQVLEAAEMAAAGKSGAEIAAHIEAIRPKVRASFVVDTLTYLHRGGRCGGLAALAGAVLKLHPRIAVVDGKMGAGKKYRGVMKKVILEYAKDMEAELLDAESKRVFITHSGCEDSVIAEVKAYLESLNYFDEILITRAGCVVSSHCGPGTLGVLFIAK